MNQAVSHLPAILKQSLGKPSTLILARNILVVVFLLWACSNLANLFWALLPAPTLPEPSSAAPRNVVIEVNTGANQGSIDIESLAAIELFGSVDATAAVEEVAPVATDIIEDARETSLNLTLKGVIKSSIPENSEAFIAHARDEKAYKVGDRLPGGNNVKLLQVQANQVILDNNGNNESLRLFEPNNDLGNSRNDSARSNVSLGRVTRDPQEILNEALEEAGVDPNSSTASDDEDDDDEDDTEPRVVTRAPKSLAEVIKFSVAREGTDIVGYRIRPGRDREIFDQLGLQPNDIVTEINGIALNNSGSITQVYREMREATSARVTLLRDGQSQSINIELDANTEE